jgi:hypothetical protein
MNPFLNYRLAVYTDAYQLRKLQRNRQTYHGWSSLKEKKVFLYVSMCDFLLGQQLAESTPVSLSYFVYLNNLLWFLQHTAQLYLYISISV